MLDKGWVQRGIAMKTYTESGVDSYADKDSFRVNIFVTAENLVFQAMYRIIRGHGGKRARNVRGQVDSRVLEDQILV